MSSDLLVFLNPQAGSADQREALEEAFRAAGAHIVVSEARGRELEQRLRAAISDGACAVGIAGGDGTISAAANVLAGSNTALLPIPLGTFNHFARRYGNASVEAAAHAWRDNSVHRIHVGTVNDRVFVNNASCGFYPRAVRLRSVFEKVLPRVLAMWLAGIAVLMRLRLLEIQLEARDRQHRLRTPALWVGIGINSLRLPAPGDAPAPHAVLEAVSGRARTRVSIIALAFRLFRHLKRGLQPQDAKMEVLRAREFTLYSHKAIDIALDGEPLHVRGPLKFAIRENALAIVCMVAPAP